MVAGPDADPLASYVSFEPDSAPWRALSEVDHYKQVFGTRSDFLVACSFDVVTIPAHAINMAGGAETSAAVRRLRAGSGRSGTSKTCDAGLGRVMAADR